MFKRWVVVSSWNPSTFRKWFPRKSARRSRYIFYFGSRVSGFFSGFFFHGYRFSLAILGFLFTTINRTFSQALFIAILKPRTQRATNRKLKLFKIMEIYIYKWKDRVYVGNQFQNLFFLKRESGNYGINNFQLNATPRLISFKHFTRSTNEWSNITCAFSNEIALPYCFHYVHADLISRPSLRIRPVVFSVRPVPTKFRFQNILGKTIINWFDISFFICNR